MKTEGWQELGEDSNEVSQCKGAAQSQAESAFKKQAK